MRDYKPYLPHHRDNRLDDLDLEGRDSNPIALLLLLVLAGVMAVALVSAMVSEQEIASARAQAALQERQRIVEAVARDLEDQRRYAAYLDRVVGREYRSIKQAGL